MGVNERMLLIKGAEARLAELDRERRDLVALIERCLKTESAHEKATDVTPIDSSMPLGLANDDGAPALHWTQRPENAAKLAKVLRKARRGRMKR